VKEWSEFHFKVQFPSLQALAQFLVVSHSVGVGTDAAKQLTSATESQLKGELCGGKSGTKHREMQLQLQKKLQQKNNEVKERKRKIQVGCSVLESINYVSLVGRLNEENNYFFV
jgi:ADP-ribosylglycohydrolase